MISVCDCSCMRLVGPFIPVSGQGILLVGKKILCSFGPFFRSRWGSEVEELFACLACADLM